MTTPSVTFNRYTVDGVTTAVADTYVIASGTMSGAYNDEDKYIYSIIIDPMETTTETVPTHEIVFDIDPNGGTEGEYFSPFSHAGSGVSPHTGEISHVRYGGVTSGTVDRTTWASGVTSGTVTIRADSGITGSGSAMHFTSADMPNSGTVWSASLGASGSAVLDVPTIYYGSFVVMNQATSTWDGVTNLHNFQMYQLHVGHEVDIADFASGTISSGTRVDNRLDLYKNLSDNGNILVNVKTYHEHPSEWELIDPSGVVVQSGTQSGTYVEDQWLFIEGLDLDEPATDKNWELRLYSSGTVKYPTPLRRIAINIYVKGSSGRFGIGIFGGAQFGVT